MSNEDKVWNNFEIEKDNNNYVIKAKDIMNSQLDKLIISFKNEVINQIIIFDKTDQITNYSLSEQEINKNKKYEFNFKIKDDITIDDQR